MSRHALVRCFWCGRGWGPGQRRWVELPPSRQVPAGRGEQVTHAWLCLEHAATAERMRAAELGLAS